MHIVKRRFDKSFRHWEIRLPGSDLLGRQRGQISQRGWVIWYLFGKDEHGEYMDYYASHRMADDRHVRLYFDRGEQRLETPLMFYRVTKDPAVTARNKAAFFSYNRATYKILAEKGLMSESEDDLAGTADE